MTWELFICRVDKDDNNDDDGDNGDDVDDECVTAISSRCLFICCILCIITATAKKKTIYAWTVPMRSKIKLAQKTTRNKCALEFLFLLLYFFFFYFLVHTSFTFLFFCRIALAAAKHKIVADCVQR